MRESVRTEGGGYSQAVEKLLQILDEGLRHGFFDYEITCETVQGNKRSLTIHAGKSHRFVITQEDLKG